MAQALEDFLAEAKPEPAGPQVAPQAVSIDDFVGLPKNRTLYLTDKDMGIDVPATNDPAEMEDYLRRQVYDKEGTGAFGTLGQVAQKAGQVGWNLFKGAANVFMSVPGMAGSLVQEQAETAKTGPTYAGYQRAQINGLWAAFSEKDVDMESRILLSGILDGPTAGISHAFLQSRVLRREIADRTNLDERVKQLGVRLQESNQAWLEKNGFKPTGDPVNDFAFNVGGGAGYALVSLGAAYATRNPALSAALIGLSQKAQLYSEARQYQIKYRDTGQVRQLSEDEFRNLDLEKPQDSDNFRPYDIVHRPLSPDKAAALSTAGGVAEGALEGLGLEIFMNTLRGQAPLRRMALRTIENTIQEVAQQGAEELIAKAGWDRPGSMQDIAHRVLYAGAVGFVVGAPSAFITTHAENKGWIGQLREAGLNDKEIGKIHEILQKTTEKIYTDAGPQILMSIENEIKLADGEKPVRTVYLTAPDGTKTALMDLPFAQGEDLAEFQKAQPKAKTLFDTPEVLADRERLVVNAGEPTIANSSIERQVLRQDIQRQLYNRGIEKRKREKVLQIVLGGPGNGKSKIEAPLVEQYGALHINNDHAKELLPEYNAGDGYHVLHAESSQIADGDLFAQGLENGDNIVISKVGKTASTIQQVIDQAREAGYENIFLHGIFLDPNKAASRVLKRHYIDKSQGFVDPDYVINVVGMKPEDVFQKLKEGVTGYARYTNDVKYGEPFQVLEAKGTEPVAGADRTALQDEAGSGGSAGLHDTSQSPGNDSGRGAASASDGQGVETPEGEISPEEQAFLDEAVAEGEPDSSFDFGANEETDLESVTNEQLQEARDLEDASKAIERFQAIQDFIKQVGKFRRFKGDYLKEELQGIAPWLFTKAKTAPALDEVADKMEISLNELISQLTDVSKKYSKARQDFRDGVKLLNEYARNEKKIRRGKKKATLKAVDVLRKHLQKRSGLKYKAIINASSGVKDPAPAMVKEADALKASIRAQARAALVAARDAKGDLQAVKGSIVELLSQALPLSARGRFISALAAAETPQDIVKVTQRVEEVVSELQRKALVSAIQKQFKRIEKSQLIDVSVLPRIRALFEGIDFTSRMKSTLRKLTQTQAFVDNMRAEGKDVQLPQYVLDRLGILAKRPASTMTIQELSNVLADLTNLANLGKKKLEIRKAIYKLRLQQDAAALKGSTPLKFRDVFTTEHVFGKKVPEVNRTNIVFKNPINLALHVELAITPTDVVIDLMDGSVGYTGPLYRIAKARIDSAWGRYLDTRRELTDRLSNLAEELKMTEENVNRIGFFAAKSQENGPEKLKQLGYTEDEINSVELTADESTLYKAMRQVLDGMRPRIAEVMRLVYNKELGDVEEYFPFMTDFEAMSDADIRDRFGNSVEQFGTAPKKNVEQGFTKTRVKGGTQKIKLNAMEIFLRHVDNAAYLVEVGEHTKYLGDLMQQEGIEDALGPVGREFMRDWVDLLARKGKAAGDRAGLADVIRRNIGVATLGFKLSTILMQPTAIFNGAALIGGYAWEGTTLVADSKWREFIKANFPEIRERIGDDEAWTDFGANKVIKDVQQKAYWAIQELDSLTAASVAAGAYKKFMVEHGQEINLDEPNAEAIAYAERIVRRSQSSPYFKDSPAMLNRGGLTGMPKLDKYIGQFQSFVLTNWSVVRHELFRMGFKPESKGQGIQIATWLLLSVMAQVTMRKLSKEIVRELVGGEPDKDEDEKVIMQELLQIVPFVPSIVSMVSYGRPPIPALGLGKDLFDRLEARARAVKPATKERADARVVLAVARLFGMPGAIQAEALFPPNKSRKKRK